MSVRFNRDYELIIGSGNTVIIVRPPMRVVFNCTKSTGGHGPNRMDIKIYNLKKSTRLQLVKDFEEVKHIPFKLSVGYDGKLQKIFKGNVSEGANTRQGSDHITSLSSLDGGYDFINSFTSKTVKGKDAVINALLADMPNTTKGKITQLNPITRPKVLVGNTCDLINKMIDADQTWFFDNEQLYIIKENDVVSAYVPVISAATGLLNTPERKSRIVTVDTLMNPTLKAGGMCELKSKNAPHLNGVYKITSMTYNGDYDGSDWQQSITMIEKDNYTQI